MESWVTLYCQISYEAKHCDLYRYIVLNYAVFAASSLSTNAIRLCQGIVSLQYKEVIFCYIIIVIIIRIDIIIIY